MAPSNTRSLHRGHSQSTFQRSGQPWGRSRSCTASRTVCNFCFCPISDCVTSATFSLQCPSFSVETRTRSRGRASRREELEPPMPWLEQGHLSPDPWDGGTGTVLSQEALDLGGHFYCEKVTLYIASEGQLRMKQAFGSSLCARNGEDPFTRCSWGAGTGSVVVVVVRHRTPQWKNRAVQKLSSGLLPVRTL